MPRSGRASQGAGVQGENKANKQKLGNHKGVITWLRQIIMLFALLAQPIHFTGPLFFAFGQRSHTYLPDYETGKISLSCLCSWFEHY